MSCSAEATSASETANRTVSQTFPARERSLKRFFDRGMPTAYGGGADPWRSVEIGGGRRLSPLACPSGPRVPVQGRLGARSDPSCRVGRSAAAQSAGHAQADEPLAPSRSANRRRQLHVGEVLVDETQRTGS